MANQYLKPITQTNFFRKWSLTKEKRRSSLFIYLITDHLFDFCKHISTICGLEISQTRHKFEIHLFGWEEIKIVGSHFQICTHNSSPKSLAPLRHSNKQLLCNHNKTETWTEIAEHKTRTTHKDTIKHNNNGAKARKGQRHQPKINTRWF